MNAFSPPQGDGRGGRMEIPARFNGPPGSGNGGWSSGTFAAAAGARIGGPPFEVTLRLPPPLDTELVVGDGAVRHGDAVVAELAEVADDLAVVEPVDLDTAVAAAEAYAGFVDHPFPTCYVCGPQRADGLRIFPGRLPDGRTAAPWTVPDDVGFATVWAALDCPGGWTALETGRPYVLGRIAVTVSELPEPGATCVVAGQPTARSGRKAMVNSTLYAADGGRLATARATWIAPA